MANIIASVTHLSPVVSFAGGEPEQHPFFPEILSALDARASVVVHTTAYQALDWDIGVARTLSEPIEFVIYSHPQKSDQDHLLRVALALVGGGHKVQLNIMRDFWNEEKTGRALQFFQDASSGLNARICLPYELFLHSRGDSARRGGMRLKIHPDGFFSINGSGFSGARMYDLAVGELERLLDTEADVISSELKKSIENTPLLREEVEVIDPGKTSVVTFSNMLAEVRQYFAEKNYSRMPDFYITEDAASNPEGPDKGIACLYENMPRDRKQDCLFFSKPGALMRDERSMKALVEICSAKEALAPLKYFQISFPQKRRQPIPDYFERNGKSLQRIFAALEEEDSKRILSGAIRTLETGDPGYLPISAYAQYQHPGARVRPGDTVIDAGLFDTEMIVNFARQAGPTGHVYGFEPDPCSYGRISKELEGEPTITVLNAGLSYKKEILKFHQAGSGSHIARGNEKGVPVTFTDLDSWLEERNLSCDVIKLDVEGAEAAVLKGAINTIKKYRPRLHISVYHMPEHYYDLPLWVLEHFPDYKLYMGHHTPWFYETILYAVPA